MSQVMASMSRIPFQLEGMENTPFELRGRSELLYLSYLLTQSLDDIQQAVLCAQEIFDLMPPNFPDPIIQYNLARSSLRLFQHTRQNDDITKATKLFRQLLTDNNPLRQKCLNYLGISYFERDGNLDGFVEEMKTLDLHGQSISSLETLSNNLGEDDEVFEIFLMTVSAYESHSQASLEDLASAIQLSRQALEFCSSNPEKIAVERLSCGHPKISIILSKLGIFLTQRFIRQNHLEDIDEAVGCCCRGVKLMLPSSPSFGYCLIHASKVLMLRFEWRRERKDLDEAVYLAQQAIQAVRLRDSSCSAMCLDNLAKVMKCRFQATNDLNDLDVAIKASIRAVNIAECNKFDHRHCCILLNNLALCLRLRSHRTGRGEDLKEAIETAQRAVDLMPPDDPIVVQCLANLISDEYMQAEKLLDIEYVKRAEQHIKKAWDICGENFGLNPGLELCLINNSASGLLRHYHLFPEMKWLDRAIVMARKGTLPVFTHHPLAGHSRRILCACLIKKWQITHKQEDIDEEVLVPNGLLDDGLLDEAIITARCTITLDESRTDESVLARKILGECLYHRYRITGVYENRQEAVDVLQEGLQMSAGAPFYRILAGQLAIDILTKQAEWEKAHQLSRKILDLLVILHGRSLDWQDKQFWLRQFSARAATYASIALEAKRDVLDVIDILEICRGTILGQVIDSRTDLADLMRTAPEKAERFKTLQNEINNMIDLSENMITRVEQIARRRKAGEEIHACIGGIRMLEGFHRFLLGPTPSELETAAAQGPIIIVNVTLIRSDAIIITKNGRVSLPLPKLKYEVVDSYVREDLTNFSGAEETRKKNKIFCKLQGWLWDSCVKLIFDMLDDLKCSPAKFHIWWIGIGIANSLPFHAARSDSGNDRETALFRAISSYTPTLKVLMHGRQKPKNDSPKPDVQQSASKPRLKIIIMPSTPGSTNLEHVEHEAEEVQKIVKGTYGPADDDDDDGMIIRWPSAKDTMAHMEECEIVHFACHGDSILTDPSSSHLLLQSPIRDSMEKPTIDKLHVRDVAVANLRHGKLAFLSACSTAQSKLTTMWDEVVHLASGFQVAGYLNAIGNLWPSDDQISVLVVKGFYQHLVAARELGDGYNVAEALNEALIDVARTYPKRPLAWAQFVHFGI